jgi:DNA topoisomerase-1
MSRLRRSDCHGPGIKRVRRGRGFAYRWTSGEPVSDEATLARIASLAIPPAWQEVWICPWPHGHIQAVGTDSAGRRQYRYHDAWRVLRDRQKFDRVLEFGRALPELRGSVNADLELEGLERRRVLAVAVRLLDLGFFRIGGEQYALENETFGVATLQRRHVKLSGGQLVFDYPAKGSIERVVTVSDPKAFALVSKLRRRRGGGDQLLEYKSGARFVPIRSDDVNAYIREATGADHTAKDFRTWAATVLAAVEMAKIASARAVGPKGPDHSKGADKRAIAAAVKRVSEYLGNTPAVCRNSYIDPKVIDRFEGGETISTVLEKLGGDPDVSDWQVREQVEAAVIGLLSGEESIERLSMAG